LPSDEQTAANGPQASPRESSARRSVSWEEFAAEAARLAERPADIIDETTRLVEDLEMDSLSLAELVVILIEKYDMYSLSKTLEERSWDNVTVRAMYDEYLTGLPPRAGTSSTA
jgi:acyl carrier protein